MKRGSRWKKALLAMLILVAWCGVGKADVQAAGTTTKSKASYTIHKYTENYGSGKLVTGKYEYQLPQLKGNTSAVRKINAALKKGYRATLTDKKNLAEYVKASNEQARYTDYYIWATVCKASYNKGGYVSFQFHHDWYAGGVHNGWTDGMTFNLKNGKKLNVAAGASGRLFPAMHSDIMYLNPKVKVRISSGAMLMDIQPVHFLFSCDPQANRLVDNRKY